MQYSLILKKHPPKKQKEMNKIKKIQYYIVAHHISLACLMNSKLQQALIHFSVLLLFMPFMAKQSNFNTV